MHKINLAVNLRDFGAKNFSGIFCDRRGAGENSWDGSGRECGLGAQEKDEGPILPGKFSGKNSHGLSGSRAPEVPQKLPFSRGAPGLFRPYLGGCLGGGAPRFGTLL